MGQLKKVLKHWYYSGNLKFALSTFGYYGKKGELINIQANAFGSRCNIFYRNGSSDPHVLYEILFRKHKSDYFSKMLPKEANVIFDIGANIGSAALFYKSIYPSAEIHSFEPMPTNIEVLQKNTEHLPNTHIHNVALSSEDGVIEMISSPSGNNEGGWSIYQRGSTGKEQKIEVEAKHSGNYIAELGVLPDIIKIDTEGAEREILKSLHEEQLSHAKMIIGELHGEQDFELLDWLEQKGFELELKKSFCKPLFIFKAIRKSSCQ